MAAIYSKTKVSASVTVVEAFVTEILGSKCHSRNGKLTLEPIYIGTLGTLFCIVCFYIKGYRFVTIKMTIDFHSGFCFCLFIW